MLKLSEYRAHADRLADHLPWAALVAPGVVLNKDGSFQRTLRFRGPDLESATEAELVGACARLNNVLRRFGSGWVLFFEAERFEAPGYPQSAFPDAASWLVDEERRAGFEPPPSHHDRRSRNSHGFNGQPRPGHNHGFAGRQSRQSAATVRAARTVPAVSAEQASYIPFAAQISSASHIPLTAQISEIPHAAYAAYAPHAATAPHAAQVHFESAYYLTLLYLPPGDQVARAEQALLERAEAEKGRDWRQDLAGFIAETERVRDLLSGFMPEVSALDDSETLTYLHGAISTRRHRVTAPETPLYLDAILADTPLSGGIEPMLGEQHLRTVTVLGFPNLTQPGILDALNHQDFAYRWTTRFIALDKTDATKTLTKLRRQWFNKRKSITALLREVMYNQPVQLFDSDADNKMLDADQALQALGGDHVSFGYLTTTITVMDADRLRAEDKRRAVERVVNGAGFSCIRESVNAVEAWLGSLPGHAYANVRQPIVHTLNLAHLVPLSSVWAGPARNDHLDGPALFHAETSGSTPFRFSTHVGDVGHMLIVGPTGAGKSVLLALLTLQFRRYAGAQIYIFDKGFSARAAVLAMGGEHHALGADAALAFQPLRGIDDPAERSWAAEWIGTLLAHEKVNVTPEIKEAVWSALNSLATAPAEQRTLTGLSVLLQSNALKSALMPYTLDGPFGRLLDAAENRLALADVQCFETEELMHQASAVLPVLTYLFHRLEDRFDGRPSLLILDEAWVYLDNPLFAARIREWLKVLRKKNVAVVFATQSLADIAESSIAPAILESCPQRIFLPNDRAIEPQARAAYERFGLNERQIELIARATPKRQYYLQSRRGNRLFELNLGPIALAFCGASSPADQKRIDAALAEYGAGGFAAGLLDSAGLPWAADLLSGFRPKSPAEAESDYRPDLRGASS